MQDDTIQDDIEWIDVVSPEEEMTKQKQESRPPRRKDRRRKGRRTKKSRSALSRVGMFFLILLIVILAVGLIAGAAWFFLSHSGRSRLMQKQEAVPEQMQQADEEAGAEAENTLEAGSIRYHGDVYTYKKDIMTFLFLGIDRTGEVSASTDRFKGGQADAMFLAVLDPDDKKIRIIGINRDTMTSMKVYDKNGKYAGKETAQIALSHAYGDGMEESCENSVDAVSNLFYGLPIHGYFALNMSVMAKLNDAVGGVDVIIPESASGLEPGWNTGDEVHLTGDAAYQFIHYRDTSKEQSAEERLERQKQYLKNFIAQAKTAMKKDMTLPLQLYTQITPYMVTDVTADEAVYLAGEALSYSFGNEDLYSMTGEVRMGEEFEEFYPDETALYEMILDVFYEKAAE